MEGTGMSEWGWDRFCTSLYLPGLPVFGTNEGEKTETVQFRVQELLSRMGLNIFLFQILCKQCLQIHVQVFQ